MAYAPDPKLQSMRNQFLKSRKDEASQAANQSLQQGEDAIQRRFASMGASGSGAQIAAMQKNRESADQVRRQGLQDVGNQELQIQEQDAGRSFQSHEADLSRGDAQAARSFQGELAGKDMAFKRELSGIEQGNKLKEIDLAERQFALDKDTTEFNKRMAEIEAGRSPSKGPLGGIGEGIGDAFRSIGNIANDPFGAAVTGSTFGMNKVVENLIPNIGGGK